LRTGNRNGGKRATVKQEVVKSQNWNEISSIYSSTAVLMYLFVPDSLEKNYNIAKCRPITETEKASVKPEVVIAEEWDDISGEKFSLFRIANGTKYNYSILHDNNRRQERDIAAVIPEI
jgi:hypothetical protein